MDSQRRRQRRLIGGIIVVAALWCLAAALVQAGVPSGPDMPEQDAALRPLAEETIPGPPTDVAASLVVMPEKFCPSYKLSYTFRLTNTSQSETIDILLVKDDLPPMTWFNVLNDDTDIGGTIPGTYHEYYDEDTEEWHKWVEWHTQDVGPGQWVEARLVLHSFSNVPTGATINNTFVYYPDEFMQSISAGSEADRARCADTPVPTHTRTPTATTTPTYTSTPTNTLTPTPTVAKYLILLPLLTMR